MVIAEPQRAFSGGQFQLVFPQLTHYGVDLWVPELGGRVDPDSEGHEMRAGSLSGLGELACEPLETFVRWRRNSAQTPEQDDLTVEVVGFGGRAPSGETPPRTLGFAKTESTKLEQSPSATMDACS